MARPCLRGLSVAFFVTSILLSAASARAQDQIKPRVLVIFDTSGSMLWPVCENNDYSLINGDNSAECTGNAYDDCDATADGLANDSRLYKVKAGLHSVVSGFGEVEFALARFAQSRQDFACPSGAWQGDACGEIQCIGQWCWFDHYYALGTLGNQADVVVPFGDGNNAEILNWMNNRSDYPNDGNSGSTGTNTCTGGDQLCTDCGDSCDKELRGNGYTPLAGSLYDMRVDYLLGGTDVVGNDPLAACRPYKVILVTDGQETCGGDPAAQAALLFGDTTKSIPVHVIGFAFTDQDDIDDLDDIASSGGTGSAIIVDNQVSLAIAIANIIAESLQSETCDGEDNDCDGLCDETFPEVAKLAVPGPGLTCSNAKSADSCTVGVGICERTGSYVCNSAGDGVQCDATPGPPNAGGEVCDNGLDDNCDGRIDEGCTPCVVQPEVCDGDDNNCNGEIDEGYVPIPCGSDIGLCEFGTSACRNGQVECDGGTPPTDEVCDGLDNNCDTIVDTFSVSCYSAGAGPTATPYARGCDINTGVCVGTCQLGSTFCGNNSWSTCTAVGPANEVCNGLDDDCDGTVDNGVDHECIDYSTAPACSTYRTCAACPQAPTEVCDGNDNDCNGTVDDIPPDPCGTDVGECSRGTQRCGPGNTVICFGDTGPTDEYCDGLDNDCDGRTDNAVRDAWLDQPCGTDVGECSQGTYQCVAGQRACVGETVGTPEICDLKDNDCDGNVDNIISVACGSDVGECEAGATACDAAGNLVCLDPVGPTDEVCDGLDNNCNGLTDENATDVGGSCGSAVGECQPGTWVCDQDGNRVCSGEIIGTTEICDGLDNDCDGTVDNVSGLGDACGTNDGECQAGSWACRNIPGAGWVVLCEGEVRGTMEICDGVDNDCDGEIDETFPEDGKTCGSVSGECLAGTFICEEGKLKCQGGGGGSDEICDAKDNDCDGEIDEDPLGEDEPCGDYDQGECKKGVTECINGAMECVGKIDPTEEICDGKDNDCDGVPDNDAICPANTSCIEGRCVSACGTGEFPCPGGTKCVDGWCIPDACAEANCSETQFCTDGVCHEKCENVTCSEHETCEPTTGLCVDNSCVTKGCPNADEICINYECVSDPCPPGKCPDNQMCVDGECLEPCINVDCPTGEICIAGKCVRDICEGYPCPDNHVCQEKNGAPVCVEDPCRIIRCDQGQVCHNGDCVDDPCATATCPSYMKCEVSHSGLANCVPKDTETIPQTTNLLAAGGGGCSCEVGHADAPSSLPWLLGLLVVIWRRRRNRK